MNNDRDTFAKLWRDVKAEAGARASKAAAVVAPHLTLDNAAKVLGVVNAALDAAQKARSLRPEPAPAPPAPTRRGR